VFSAITNIIFTYPQPVRRVTPGVCVPRVGNHCSISTKGSGRKRLWTNLTYELGVCLGGTVGNNERAHDGRRFSAAPSRQPAQGRLVPRHGSSATRSLRVAGQSEQKHRAAELQTENRARDIPGCYGRSRPAATTHTDRVTAETPVLVSIRSVNMAIAGTSLVHCATHVHGWTIIQLRPYLPDIIPASYL
jgi:hypothetical protein